MLPASREVEITAEDEEKGIWLVKDKASAQTESKAVELE